MCHRNRQIQSPGCLRNRNPQQECRHIHIRKSPQDRCKRHKRRVVPYRYLRRHKCHRHPSLGCSRHHIHRQHRAGFRCNRSRLQGCLCNRKRRFLPARCRHRKHQHCLRNRPCRRKSHPHPRPPNKRRHTPPTHLVGCRCNRSRPQARPCIHTRKSLLARRKLHKHPSFRRNHLRRRKRRRRPHPRGNRRHTCQWRRQTHMSHRRTSQKHRSCKQ